MSKRVSIAKESISSKQVFSHLEKAKRDPTLKHHHKGCVVWEMTWTIQNCTEKLWSTDLKVIVKKFILLSFQATILGV